ncbi:hypothetical protein Dimus_003700 [Dionaea muscipula]
MCHEGRASAAGLLSARRLCACRRCYALPTSPVSRLDAERGRSLSSLTMVNLVVDSRRLSSQQLSFRFDFHVLAIVIKEFYARLTTSHNRKKDVAKSSVRGIEIEFDHMKLAFILGILGNNGICEYIKEAWEESRRRDDEIEAQAENVHEEEEAQNVDFDWEAVIDEAAVEGESGSDDQFFDAQVNVEEPVIEGPAAPTFPASPGDSTTQPKEPEAAGVDPSGPSGHITESVMIKLQA